MTDDTAAHFKLPFWLPWMRFAYPNVIWKTTVIVSVLYVVVLSATADGIYHFDADTPTTHFIEQLFPFPAANAGEELIPLSRMRLQVAALSVYDAQNGQTLTRRQTEQIVLHQIVNRTLYRQALAAHGTRITSANVDSQLQTIANSVGGQDKLTSFLSQQSGPTMTLVRFRDWVVADSLAEAAVQQQLLVRTTLSHLLVAVPADATAEQIEAARQKALGYKTKITTPDRFAEIAKQYSDDVASRDNGGQLGTTVRGSDSKQYSPTFEQTIFTLPVNQVSDPVRSQYGWHLLLVTKREGSVDLSLADYSQKLYREGHAKIFIKSN